MFDAGSPHEHVDCASRGRVIVVARDQNSHTVSQQPESDARQDWHVSA